MSPSPDPLMPAPLMILVTALLLLAVVALVVLLAREKGLRRRAEERLAREAALDRFADGDIYTLQGVGATELDGEPHHFGVVTLEDGSRRLFLTTDDTSALAPGETFSSVRGRLVSLRSRRAAAPSPLAGAGAANLPDEDEDEDDSQRTRIFRAPPAVKVDDGFGQPFLEVTAGPDAGRRYLLSADTVRIGREPGNEVALTDGGASRVHCQVSYADGRFRLRDNNSTNGTLLNGEPATQASLEFGDLVQVAETQLRFSCEGYDLRDSDRVRAIAAFERCLERMPDLLPALRMLAFLLERDVARRAEAEPLWARVARLEGGD